MIIYALYQTPFYRTETAKILFFRQIIIPLHHMPARNLFTVLLTLSLFSCGGHREKTNAVYYWSTTFRSDSTQKAFLHKHHIGKMYLRFFDVVVDEQDEVMPNATVRFASSVPEGVEIVPVVYIVNDCLYRTVDKLDSLILQRVVQMCETNDITNFKELQIDCDWTLRTRAHYFDILTQLKERAKKQGITLSATIRLHQLGEKPPPVDRGVLMMYNTGDVTRIDCEHPILDIRDAAPYLRHLSDYQLPLSAAYPVYAWRVLFRNSKFVGIIHDDDELPVMDGDSIVVRQPPLEMVTKTKEAIAKEKPEINDEIVLFDISNDNLQRINKYHYETILNP